MAAIIRKCITAYLFVFDEITDPRTKGWFLIARPYQWLTILVLYFLFVFKWGPKLMKNRQPFNLDVIMMIHNAIQIICCAYLFIIGTIKWIRTYKLFCEPIDYSNTEEAIEIATFVYYYFVLKIFDLADTIFVVLRKKYSQASFLHVYHHTGMFILSWGAVTYIPGGHGLSVGLVNCFVHVVMYSYYLLSIAVPKIKETIWIKKIVTKVQITQFFIFVVHIGAIVFIPDCAYPRWTAAVFVPQNLFLLMLFVDYYTTEYIKKPKQSVENLEEENKIGDSKSVGSKENVSESTQNIVKRVTVRN